MPSNTVNNHIRYKKTGISELLGISRRSSRINIITVTDIKNPNMSAKSGAIQGVEQGFEQGVEQVCGKGILLPFDARAGGCSNNLVVRKKNLGFYNTKT